MMITSKQLFEQLKQFEGLRLEAYQDAGGVWTIGYGHTYHVRQGDRISPFWAEEMLRKDIDRCVAQVLALVDVQTQSQLDALVSFTFNLGIGRLKVSTLLQKVQFYVLWEPANGVKFEQTIKSEFMRWHYCNGRPLKGLQLRRKWEAERFFAEKRSDTAACARFVKLLDEYRREHHGQD